MNQRPLSPHLQVYRLPVTGVLSIAHRISGVLVAIGASFLVLLPLSIAQGPGRFAIIHELLASVPGRLLVWLWILLFLFHLCHGFRHLLWDIGLGFSRENLFRNAVLELAACLTLAAVVWLVSSSSP